MFIQNLFLWVYCMPISQMMLLTVLVTVLLLILHHRLRRRWWWNAGLAIVLLGGVFVVVYQTVLSRSPGQFQAPVFIPFHSYLQVLQGGNPELLRSNLMNVLLFFPLGMCAALLLSRWNSPGRKILLITCCFCCLSCSIEYAQIRYGLGLGELDDILHNTLGAFLGALFAILFPKLPNHIRTFRSRHR